MAQPRRKVSSPIAQALDDAMPEFLPKIFDVLDDAEATGEFDQKEIDGLRRRAEEIRARLEAEGRWLSRSAD